MTLDAKVLSKRMNISGGMNNSTMSSTSTYYYVTFEFDSGDRLELKMGGYEFGMIVESDIEKLTFQGNRYLGFERLE